MKTGKTDILTLRWQYNCYPNDPAADNEAGVDWFNAQFGL
jgi:hypothetical protein